MAKNMAKITVEPGKLEILVEREFEAPRELVFKALTHPELYAQWVGPRGFSTTIETFEPRNGASGGSYRKIKRTMSLYFMECIMKLVPRESSAPLSLKVFQNQVMYF